MEDLAISAASAEGTTTIDLSGDAFNPSGQCERLLVATNLTHLLA